MLYTVDNTNMISWAEGGVRIPQPDRSNPNHPHHDRWQVAWNRRLLVTLVLLSLVFRAIDAGAAAAFGDVLMIAASISVVIVLAGIAVIVWLSIDWIIDWMNNS